MTLAWHESENQMALPCSVGFQIGMRSALGSAFPTIDGADGRRSWKHTSSVTHLICCCLSSNNILCIFFSYFKVRFKHWRCITPYCITPIASFPPVVFVLWLEHFKCGYCQVCWPQYLVAEYSKIWNGEWVWVRDLVGHYQMFWCSIHNWTICPLR
jgi:hypothetical protein